ncbi:MAG: SdrD B-like domain-containing protein [Chloroflexota bacterium]
MSNNQIQRIRTIINALMIAAMLAGLIPPPVFTHVADLKGFENLSGLVAPSIAYAAPGDNIALNGTATQSSNLDAQQVASNAIDNNTNGAVLATDAHTAQQNNPWWQVDLGSIQSIDTITIWKLTFCCSERSQNLTIFVSDTAFTSNDPTTTAAQAGVSNYSIGTYAGTSTSVTVNRSGRYVRVQRPGNNVYLALPEVQVFEGAPLVQPGEVRGTVFLDSDISGAQNGSEGGLANITVMAVDANGTTATTTTDASGVYTITAGSGLSGDVRVEFSLPGDGSLNFLEPTIAGGTTVQFSSVVSGTIVDAGFHYPAGYCQANPDLCAPVYVNGTNDTSTPDRAMMRWPYNNSGFNPTPTQIVDKSQSGTTWGVAYNRSNQTIYHGAFLKRHSGLGPGGLGAIYATPRDGSSTSVFVDLTTLGASVGTIADNATRGLTTPQQPNNDPDAYPLVGKVGLGDLDISEDNSVLYAVSLNDETVYAINTNDATLNASYALSGPGCTSGNWRPFALKVHMGKVYAGGVCDAASGAAANLSAHIYRLDGSTFTEVFTFPLNYAKGPTVVGYVANCNDDSGWYPWQDTVPASCGNAGGAYYSRPQPMLSDIEFDTNGDMILGFMDRFGHQTGTFNYRPDSNILMVTVSGGDILRACVNGNGGWDLENGGVCGSNTGSTNNADGPGGGEFYHGDIYIGGNAANHHDETGAGGLAQHPTTGEVVMTGMDPLTTQLRSTNTGGVFFLSNTNGARLRGYELYPQIQPQTSSWINFGKSHGVGDVELLCDEAPLEIGNRVWEDTDGDGTQDPGEPPIENVTVELYDSGNNLIATAETDQFGNYLFSGGAGTDTASAIYAIPELTPNATGFEVRIPNAEGGSQQAELAGLFLTQANTDADLRDSDGILNGTTAVAAFDTGSAGANNHTYDFGFTNQLPPDLEIAKWLNTPPTITVGSLISFTIRITNTGGTVFTSLPLTDTYDTTYLTFDPIADAGGPNPADDAVDDGIINWSNIILYDGNNQLDPNETLDIVVVFTAKAETTNLAGNNQCESAGRTYNLAEAFGKSACTEVPIDPSEAKLTLGDYIWHDIDNDGQQDANEPGINGVVVNLYDVTGGANTFITTTTTVMSNTVDGFYQFDVVSGNDYLVEVASSNFDPGGPLEGFVLGANQGTINNDADPDQTALNVTVNDDTLDFGFYCEFDLALVKTLAAGQSSVILPGDDVTFTLTIYNQGVVTATDISLADYIPAGFTLNDGNWSGPGSGPSTVTRVLAGPLTPNGTANDSASVDIVLTAGIALSGTYTNTAEIITYTSSILDVNGNSLPDVDSTPDDTDGNGSNGNGGESTDIEDDQINEDGTAAGQDEDDHDPATVTVTSAPEFVAIGNLVWLDDGAGGGTANNGELDGTESGIDGVTVQLFNQGDDPLTAAPISTTLTAGGGFYEFDNLTPGLYFVHIPATEFQLGGDLENQVSSTGNGTDETTDQTSDENGIDNVDSATNGISSIGFDLQPNVEATGEDQGSYNGTLDDNNVNFTADFAFWQPVPTIDVEKATTGPGQMPQDADTPNGPSINVGDIVTWTYEITNSGSVTLTTITLVDDVQGTVATCPQNTLAPGMGMTCLLTGIAQAGQYSNTAVVTGTPTLGPATPITDTDPSHYIGESFDLALTKGLAPSQGATTIPGDPVTFLITVYNQGSLDAFDIDVIDYIPADMIYTSSNVGTVANSTNGNAVAITDNGGGTFEIETLASGDNVAFEVTLTIDGAFQGSSLRNWAEIQDATDTDGGTTTTDIDSTPNGTNFSEPGETDDLVDDDVVNEDGKNGGDEDDHDPSEIVVVQPGTPIIALDKLLNGVGPFTEGEPISFTIRITNTGSVTITTLPLTDTYDVNYLTYDAAIDLTGPNPATQVANDGTIFWANVIDFDGDNQLVPNEVLDLTVTFIAIAETTNAAASECAPAGDTFNKATAMGRESCVPVHMDPPEPKSAIGDWVWHDINNDGIKDANEPGINGVRVNLYQDGTNGGTLDGVPEASELITFTVTADDVGGLGDDTGGTNGAGFYRFDVAAEENDLYLVEIDASNFNPGGELEGFTYSGDQGGQPYNGTQPRSILIPAQLPINEQNVDFGFYCRFDLALEKQLAAGQSATISPGDDVTFTMTVYNQGVVTATNVTIADYIPVGFALNDGNWNAGPIGTVTRTLATTLTPSGTVGASTTVDIVLTAGASLNGIYTNTAEIADFDTSIKDGNGDNLPDADSDADSTDGNGPGETTDQVDDEVNEDGKNGGDEDDHDPAQVTVLPSAPSLAVSKILNGDNPFGVNETISFTIRITNTGNVTLTVIPLEDRYSDLFLRFESATVTPDVSSGNGILVWSDLTTVLGDVGPNGSISLDVTFTTLADTTLLRPVAPCSTAGHTPNIVQVDNAVADPDGPGAGTPIAVTMDGDDIDCAEVQILNPTAVTLAGRSISQIPGGVLVQWSTESKSNIIGFQIWKSSGLNNEVRSNEMILATNPGESSVTSYQWLDASTMLERGDAYVLEIIMSDGSTERTVIDVVTGGTIFLPLLAR